MEIQPLPALNRRVWLLAMVGELVAAGCRDHSSTGKGDATAMKTLDDLVAFIDMVLAPEFDIAAAEIRFGKIDRWVGALAKVKSAHPALKDVVIETFKGSLDGVQITLTSPLEVGWSDLKQALGKPERGTLTVDDWGGPIPYEFHREVSGSRGLIILYIKDHGGSMARIHEFIVRQE